MNRRCVRRGLVASLLAAAVITSCGGSDSDDGAAQDAGSTDVSTTATENDTGTSDVAEGSDTTAATTESGDDESDVATSGEVGTCDAIFSMTEIEEFFAEPAELTEETNESLGQLVCTWESIEDPSDSDDLAYKILVVQFYSGDPIDAANFFDPSIYESVTMIDGIGDLAYSVDDLGPSFDFVDEPVGGSLSYSEVDLGNVDAPKLHTQDDVEQLFRTFYDRVT